MLLYYLLLKKCENNFTLIIYTIYRIAKRYEIVIDENVKL